MTPNITAIILAKNASTVISRCLSSVSWCEHVIVGDDGSTDDTIAIAKDHKADVIKIRPTHSYAEKRNELLRYVRTEWVLFVDSDEVVAPELRRILEQGSWRDRAAVGFLIQRMDVFMGRKLVHGETAHTWLLRFAKKDAGGWTRSVHEVWDVNGKVEKLKGELYHYAHPDLEGFLEKINRYTDLEAQERIKHVTWSTVPVAYVQLLVYPIAKFVQNFFIRQGILDDFPGFVMAFMMSIHSLCVRIKMLERLRARIS